MGNAFSSVAEYSVGEVPADPRASARATFERRPATILEVDLDYCNNTFGMSPCAAGRIESGTAQAGTSSTITLRAAASSTDDAYAGMTVRVTGGTGSGQEGKVASYVGATKVATMTASWTTAPDATSVYDVIDRPNGCYNVFGGDSPCQDPANFSRGIKTIRFSLRGMTAPAGEQIRPYIASASATPTQIDPTKCLAARSQTTVTMADEPGRDDLDKYIDDRASPAGGTFWPRLIARNPNAIGRFARLRKGFVVDPWDWGTFQTELYVVDQLKGPDGQGQVQLVLSDAVKLLDRVKLPAATDGKLQADVKAISDSGAVQSATSTTAVLPSSASDVDDAYTGQEIHIIGGLGLDQRRVVTGYVGLTRTATVAAWTTTPDTTSLYEIIPLSIDVGSGKGAQYNDPTVTGRAEYVRIGDEVIRYTAITGDVLSWPDGTYKAQFGTTAADHKANDGVQQCLAWTAATASSVVQDLCNWGGLADSYVDLVGLAAAEDTWFGTKAAITACIPDPTTGSELLADLLIDLNMMAWWHPVDQQMKFKVNMPELGGAPAALSDDNFIRSTTSAERLDTERLTRAALYFDPISATSDLKKPTSYRTVQIYIDTDAESANGYGDERADVRYSRWMTSGNSVFAGSTVERRLLAKRDAPMKIKASLDPKDEISLGSLADISTKRTVGADGNPKATRHRIVKVTDKGGQIDIETRSTTFGKRYAFVCPTGYPDYPSATVEQLQRAFIAQPGGLMSDGTEGYLIL